MATISIQRTRNGVLRSADSATLQVLTSAGVVAVATTPITPVSEGVYSYDADFMTAGNYTAIWTFAQSGYPSDVISRVFTLDAPAAQSEGATLMDIEQRVARRCGPYKRVQATTGSTVVRLVSTTLQSSIALGSYEDQFMLRRGVTMAGAWLPVYTSNDRVRMVATYESDNGRLINDREWTNAPDVTNGEGVEVLALDPTHEIRPAVLAGLKRCFFWDTVTISLTAADQANLIDVTAQVPWVTEAAQIREVSFSYASQWSAPVALPWWKAHRSGKNIFLRTQGAFVGSLMLDVLRPASTLVNGEISLTGPNDDLDVVYVDAEYATWAGVIEMWKDHAHRLMPLTREGLGTSLKDASHEFTKKGLRVASELPERARINFGPSDLGIIGNLAEPV